LINKVVSAGQLEAATLDLIQRATRGSALSKDLGKQGFYHQVDLPQQQAYAFAVERMASAALLPDAQEGIAAFFEKRVAAYRQVPDRGT
jgi:enoyl-CoA hydratase/carnithine racemase